MALATLAADEAKLPDDAQFRAAFQSYLEWGSRQPATEEPPGSPLGLGPGRATGHHPGRAERRPIAGR